MWQTEQMLLALGLDQGLTSTSPLRDIIKVYIQLSTYEWIKVRRKIDKPWYLVLLDKSVSEKAKRKEIIGKINNYYIRPKHWHYRSCYANSKKVS